MSIVFTKHLDQSASCPSCQHPTQTSGDTEIQCSGCSLIYQRVTEIEEETIEQRSAPVPAVQRPSAAFRPSKLSRQRTVDSLASGDEIRHFKRVRIILQEASFSRGDSFSTMSIMVHKPGGSHTIRLALLDIGSSVNLIGEKTVKRLGVDMQPHNGKPISSLGGEDFPMGNVTLDWHVKGHHKTYTTEFGVIAENQSRGFDVLLGSTFIERSNILMPNRDVY